MIYSDRLVSTPLSATDVLATGAISALDTHILERIVPKCEPFCAQATSIFCNTVKNKIKWSAPTMTI
jgi:hypothetical protein